MMRRGSSSTFLSVYDRMAMVGNAVWEVHMGTIRHHPEFHFCCTIVNLIRNLVGLGNSAGRCNGNVGDLMAVDMPSTAGRGCLLASCHVDAGYGVVCFIVCRLSVVLIHKRLPGTWNATQTTEV
ncbi:hypothetical protein IV203_027098 [Nitzschia inconspicua]|uniref:Uncharacterized protein n=1 Tax=Nitzschia inconspicua TaxID=303405 RepID=A0A9K3LKH2_9STRA|nr:hypothetical protein IV203_027098 [Nitzschia inconspicua]